MKNRYENNLRKYNAEILKFCPANTTSRYILALELKKSEREGLKVLEIGCGEGDSALPILENTKLDLDLSDISEEMIEVCKQNLASYKDRLTYICEDCLAYLKRCEPYDVIFSAYTIHNFIQDEKIKLFNEIYNKLKPGGIFLLMDKVYPQEGAREQLDHQIKRYDYLPSEVKDEMVNHEEQDFLPEYRMHEGDVIDSLSRIGFVDVKIVDRLERAVVLIAKKK